jgi:hypothetical protein
MLMVQSVSDELKNEVCGMNNFNDGLFVFPCFCGVGRLLAVQPFNEFRHSYSAYK